MNNLFESVIYDLPDAEIVYYPHFFEPIEADVIFNELIQIVPWQQDNIKVFGKTYPQPRLTALYGDEGKTYSYSNLTMKPHPWTELLLQIKNQVEIVCGSHFTTVLINLYRDGKDSNGWHADNEKELGVNPIIASLSLGAERYFHLKHNSLKDCSQKILLENGSMLLMKGSTQHFWKHHIPKTQKEIGPRINLTFRSLK